MSARTVRVVRTPLPEIEVEGVVNPIRSDLSPVNSASRDLLGAAGSKAVERLHGAGSIPLGGAVITPGGSIAADFLIHAVVMTEDHPQTTATVQKALQNALRRAADWELSSLALPPLGLGVGLIDTESQARALMEVLYNHLDEGSPPLDLTVAVTSEYQAELFEGLAAEMDRAREDS